MTETFHESLPPLSKECSSLLQSVIRAENDTELDHAMQGLSLASQPQSIQEEASFYLFQNTYFYKLDNVLEHCDPSAVVRACISVLLEAAHRELDSPDALPLTLSYIRRTFLKKRHLENTANDFVELVSLLVLLPLQISNACHKQKLLLPLWATRSSFLSRLLCTALSNDGGAAPGFSPPLIVKLARMGSYDEVALGCYDFYRSDPREQTTASEQIASALDQTRLTNREKVYIMRATVRLVVARESSQVQSGSLKALCLTTLDSSVSLQTSWTHLMILNASSVPRDQAMSCALCKAVLDLLAACTGRHILEDDGVVGDDDDSDDGSDDEFDHDDQEHNRSALNRTPLAHQTLEVASIWSQKIFVQQNELRTQHHASRFLVLALERQKRNVKDDPKFPMTLVKGVSLRLESSIVPVRLDGMKVGQALAQGLGESLEFDELNKAEKNKAKDIEAPKLREESDGRVINKPRRRKPLDPDDEVLSSDDDDERSESHSTNDEGSFVWDDELIPYDLDDDEEDLRQVQKPRYLRECLELIRLPESDAVTANSHQTGLEELEGLVRERPADLQDVAVPLARYVVRMENKFDWKQFGVCRQAGLVALAAEEPVQVGEVMICELFGENGLMVRFDCLHTLEEAACELCGATELANARTVARPGRAVTDLKSRTRRWGKGRRHSWSRKTVVNKFMDVAPLWFYGLIAGFMKRKEDPKMFAGANGGRLLSMMLVTLATFVECAMHRVLAKDLVEFAWSFRTTEVAELRGAVLVALVNGFAALGEDGLALVFSGHGPLATLPEYLHSTIQNEPDDTCRAIAKVLSTQLIESAEGRNLQNRLEVVRSKQR